MSTKNKKHNKKKDVVDIKEKQPWWKNETLEGKKDTVDMSVQYCDDTGDNHIPYPFVEITLSFAGLLFLSNAGKSFTQLLNIGNISTIKPIHLDNSEDVCLITMTNRVEYYYHGTQSDLMKIFAR